MLTDRESAVAERSAAAFEHVMSRVLCHLLLVLGRVQGLEDAIVALDGFEFVSVPATGPSVDALDELRAQRLELRGECALLWAGYLALVAETGRVPLCGDLVERVTAVVAVFGIASESYAVAMEVREVMAREILDVAAASLTTDGAAEPGVLEGKVT